MVKSRKTYSISVVADVGDPITDDDVRPLQKLGVAARIAAAHGATQRLIVGRSRGEKRITLKIEGDEDELNELLEELESAKVEFAS